MSFFKVVEDDLRALSVEARKNNLSRLGMVKEAAERAKSIGIPAGALAPTPEISRKFLDLDQPKKDSYMENYYMKMSN